MTWANILSTIISLVALGLAAYSLYLQRRDKKPQLGVHPKFENRPLIPEPTEYGGVFYREAPAVCIYLPNPGEKTVRVSSLNIIPDGGERVPMSLKEPLAVEPHTRGEILIKRAMLRDKLEESGYKHDVWTTFEVIDELGNRYESDVIRFTFDKS